MTPDDIRYLRDLLALIFPDSHGGAVPLLRFDPRNPAAIVPAILDRLRVPVDIGDHTAIVAAIRVLGREAAEPRLLAVADDSAYPLTSRACALCACPIRSMIDFGGRVAEAEDADSAVVFTLATMIRWLDLVANPVVPKVAADILATNATDEQREDWLEDIEETRRLTGIPAAVLYADAIADPRLAEHRRGWLDLIAKEGGPGATQMLLRVSMQRRIDPRAQYAIAQTALRLGEEIEDTGFRHPAEGRAVFVEHGKVAMFRAAVAMRRGVHFSVAYTAAKPGKVEADVATVAAGPPWIEPELEPREVPLASALPQAFAACVRNRAQIRKLDYGLVVAFCVMDGPVPPGSPDWLPTSIIKKPLRVVR